MVCTSGSIGADGKERTLGALDRDVDEREGRDLLRLAVLEDLEVVRREVGDRRSLRVGDDRIDLDVVDFDAEGDRGLIRGRRRRLGRWLLLCGQQAATQGGESQGKRKSQFHKFSAGAGFPILAGIRDRDRDSGLGIRDSDVDRQSNRDKRLSQQQRRRKNYASNLGPGSRIANPESRA